MYSIYVSMICESCSKLPALVTCSHCNGHNCLNGIGCCIEFQNIDDSTMYVCRSCYIDITMKLVPKKYKKKLSDVMNSYYSR